MAVNADDLRRGDYLIGPRGYKFEIVAFDVEKDFLRLRGPFRTFKTTISRIPPEYRIEEKKNESN